MLFRIATIPVNLPRRCVCLMPEFDRATSTILAPERPRSAFFSLLLRPRLVLTAWWTAPMLCGVGR